MYKDVTDPAVFLSWDFNNLTNRKKNGRKKKKDNKKSDLRFICIHFLEKILFRVMILKISLNGNSYMKAI